MTNTAIVVLASGLSSRFGSENKLLSEFRGKPLCSYSAALANEFPKSVRLAIVPAGNKQLENVYSQSNWTTLYNHNPKAGLSTSIHVGVRAALERNVEGVLICLADMPLIEQSHIDQLLAASLTNDAVMSRGNGTLLPPAAFKSHLFDELLSLKGDAGAKSVFLSVENKLVLELPIDLAADVDTPSDLKELNRKDRARV